MREKGGVSERQREIARNDKEKYSNYENFSPSAVSLRPPPIEQVVGVLFVQGQRRRGRAAETIGK